MKPNVRVGFEWTALLLSSNQIANFSESCSCRAEMSRLNVSVKEHGHDEMQTKSSGSPNLTNPQIVHNII